MQASSLSTHAPEPPAPPLHPSLEPKVPLRVLFRQKLLTAFTRYFTAQNQLPPGWGHLWFDQQPNAASSTPCRGETPGPGASDAFLALTELAGDDENLHEVPAGDTGSRRPDANRITPTPFPVALWITVKEDTTTTFSPIQTRRGNLWPKSMWK